MKQALTLLALLSLPWPLVAEPKTWATSAPFELDINSGTRETAGDETLAYDSNWYANGSKIAYKISVNGKDLAQGDGCGEVDWTTHRPGVYEVVASSYEDGVLVDSSLTATFEFKGKDLVNADVAFASDENILYDGTAKTPSVSVVLNGETLVEGVDYELGYEENIQPGVGKVVVRGKGRFSDEIEVPFTIVPAGICSLDIESGVREASATELLNFDSTWLGTSGAENRVTVNGAQVGAGTGVGVVAWSPIAAGDYALEYKVYEEGVEQEATYAAQFHVSQGEVPLEIELSQDQFMFADGAAVPQVTVRYQGATLTEGTDYALAFVDNDHSGLAKVVVTGMGAYSGTVEKQFRILPSATLSLDIQDGVRVIAGESVEQIAYENAWDGGTTVKVAVNGVNVVEGGTVGTYEWTPAGIGLYTLTHATYNEDELGNVMSAQFYIPGSLDDAEVVLDFDECLFDGMAKCPTPVVTKDGAVLTQGLDYEVEYQNNVAAGAATVVVVGANGERIERTFTIRPAGICSLDIESGVREAKASESLMYDGLWKGAADADYRIWIDGAELSAGSGCGEAIWNPRAVGDHVATYRTYVDGAKVGDDLSAKFHVSGRDLVNASVKLNEETILYDGTAREPKATITYEGKTLVEGEDYELSYRDNIESGTGILTITGKGEFVDIVDVPFTIRPAGICSLDIESGYRQAKAEELLAFDYKWKGDTADNTRLAIRVNDVVLTNMTGVGDAVWKPTAGGNYVVTLRTYIDDYLQDEDILTAYFGEPRDSGDGDGGETGDSGLSVSGLSVTPIPPWGLAIDFTVDGVTADDDERALEVTMAVNGVTNVAKSVWGETNCVDGVHRIYWNTAKDGISVEKGKAVISVRYKPPLYCVIDLSGGTSATSFAVSYRSTSPKGSFNASPYKTTNLVLRCCSAGVDPLGRYTLTKDFYVGVFEVTQKQWELVMGTTPSHFSGNTKPVECVSYDDIRGSLMGTNWPASSEVDADSFMGVLRAKTGLKELDLPTEAQWEYACRAGTTTKYNLGDNESDLANAGWYTNNSSLVSHPVGQKTANAWGLYDMHGNVWEWCLDWWSHDPPSGSDFVGAASGEIRHVRGGSWGRDAESAESSCRRTSKPSNRITNMGLRVFMTVKQEGAKE